MGGMSRAKHARQWMLRFSPTLAPPVIAPWNACPQRSVHGGASGANGSRQMLHSSSTASAGTAPAGGAGVGAGAGAGAGADDASGAVDAAPAGRGAAVPPAVGASGARDGAAAAAGARTRTLVLILAFNEESSPTPASVSLRVPRSTCPLNDSPTSPSRTPSRAAARATTDDGVASGGTVSRNGVVPSVGLMTTCIRAGRRG